VVTPQYQGNGFGRAPTERLLQQAKERGVKRLFLLTETAPAFCRKFGFRNIAGQEADVAVRQSVEFQTACCQSAVCMRLDL
jgi:N-acetylglutamate synthase-like GNAT family acetyltransferase